MSSQGETRANAVAMTEMTLDEVLAIAMDFERSAYRTYTGLADKVAADVRPLVHELAKEELHHYALLEDLSRRSDLLNDLNRSMAVAPTTERFRSYVTLPRFVEGASENEILAYAEARERIAHEHYAYLAELTPPGKLRDLFTFLRDEEEKHVVRVEGRWSETYSIL